MDSGRIKRLRFTVSDENLERVIRALSGFYPSVLHPRAWASVMSEMEHRQAGRPPQAVVMMSGVFETLPSVVQALLRDHDGAEQRRAA
jgi:hypothetical protein